MAKKDSRIIFALECTKCKKRNYTSKKSKVNTQDKISLSKFCPNCNEHTKHKEVKVK